MAWKKRCGRAGVDFFREGYRWRLWAEQESVVVVFESCATTFSPTCIARRSKRTRCCTRTAPRSTAPWTTGCRWWPGRSEGTRPTSSCCRSVKPRLSIGFWPQASRSTGWKGSTPTRRAKPRKGRPSSTEPPSSHWSRGTTSA
ncbi:unnamed protein product [Ectocarpus fasciculatus]